MVHRRFAKPQAGIIRHSSPWTLLRSLQNQWADAHRSPESSGLSGAVAVDVLDGGFVAPGDVGDFHIEDIGDVLAFLGTGGPAAQQDGGRAALVETGLLGQFHDGYFFLLA